MAKNASIIRRRKDLAGEKDSLLVTAETLIDSLDFTDEWITCQTKLGSYLFSSHYATLCARPPFPTRCRSSRSRSRQYARLALPRRWGGGTARQLRRPASLRSASGNPLP